MSDDNVIYIEEFLKRRELKKHLDFLDKADKESQRSVKSYIMGLIKDEALHIVRTEINDNYIKIEFIKEEKK